MPSPGKSWYHIILNTRGSWLPGDPRGFRSRAHRIHSSGDYKNPPPTGEHAVLHNYAKLASKPPVTLPADLRALVGDAILRKSNQQGFEVIAICVGSNHVHVLAELPNSRNIVKETVGLWKQSASHRVRAHIPGKVWASGCDPILIKYKSHHRRVFGYILKHREEGAWVWSFRDR